MKYVFHTRVSKVERKRQAVRATKPDPNADAIVEYEDLGWFVHLAGAFASVAVGQIKPEWVPGQLVTLSIEDEKTPGAVDPGG